MYLESIEEREYQTFLEELESIRRQEEIERNKKLFQVHPGQIKSSVFKMTVSLGSLFESVAPLVSLALDFIPIIGQIKGVTEAIIGRDLITGEELEDWERGLEAVFLFLPFAKTLPFAQKAFAAGGKVAGAVNQAARQKLQKLAAIAYQLQRAKNIDPRQVYQLSKRIIEIPKQSLLAALVAARMLTKKQLLPEYAINALRDIQKALSDIPAVRTARKGSKDSKSVASGKKSTNPPASTRGTTTTNDPRGTQARGTQNRSITRSLNTSQGDESASRMIYNNNRSSEASQPVSRTLNDDRALDEAFIGGQEEGLFQTAPRLARGNLGERLAADALAAEGHTILSYKPSILGTNQGGIDIVTIRNGVVYLIDNKALTRAGNISSVSALTTNLTANLQRVRQELVNILAQQGISAAQRNILQQAIDAIDNRQIIRAVTNANVARDGAFLSGVTQSLQNQGIQFINVLR